MASPASMMLQALDVLHETKPCFFRTILCNEVSRLLYLTAHSTTLFCPETTAHRTHTNSLHPSITSKCHALPSFCSLTVAPPPPGPVPVPVPDTPNNSFPDFRKALSLHMVETSGNLKALQVKALGATLPPTASYSASRGGGGGGGTKEQAGNPPMQLPGGGEVVWHTAIEQVRREGGRNRPLTNTVL